MVAPNKIKFILYLILRTYSLKIRDITNERTNKWNKETDWCLNYHRHHRLDYKAETPSFSAQSTQSKQRTAEPPILEGGLNLDARVQNFSRRYFSRHNNNINNKEKITNHERILTGMFGIYQKPEIHNFRLSPFVHSFTTARDISLIS